MKMKMKILYIYISTFYFKLVLMQELLRQTSLICFKIKKNLK